MLELFRNLEKKIQITYIQLQKYVRLADKVTGEPESAFLLNVTIKHAIHRV